MGYGPHELVPLQICTREVDIRNKGSPLNRWTSLEDTNDVDYHYISDNYRDDEQRHIQRFNLTVVAKSFGHAAEQRAVQWVAAMAAAASGAAVSGAAIWTLHVEMRVTLLATIAARRIIKTAFAASNWNFQLSA